MQNYDTILYSTFILNESNPHIQRIIYHLCESNASLLIQLWYSVQKYGMRFKFKYIHTINMLPIYKLNESKSQI